MLKVGARLAALKKSGEWQEIVNPEDGEIFLYSSFEKFCKHAFGFSKTRTSNFLSLAEFVELDEATDEIIYKNAKYLGMNTSKLIELAPLNEWQREYFTADLSVADMRICKRYVNSGAFYDEKDKEGFDLLTSAQAWTERLKAKEERQAAEEVNEELRQAAFALGADPDVSNFYEDFYSSAVPTSELNEETDEETDEIEAEIPTSELTARETEKPNFTSRTKVRAFLSEYESWERVSSGNEFFEEIRRYRFKDGAELFAAKCKMCVSLDGGEKKGLLFFFLSLGRGARPIKISKLKLEIWLRANETTLF